jgi:hypothetical protein
MNCECGCGLRAPVYRGRQCRYLRGHCGAQKAKKKIRYFVKEGTGCWIWLLCTRDGYGKERVGDKVGGAHVHSYERHRGPVPAGMVLDHVVCGNRRCVNPWHLEVVTATENSRRGRNAKINQQIADEIRRMKASGITQTEIARVFGVSWSLVSDVVRGNTWRPLTLEQDLTKTSITKAPADSIEVRLNAQTLAAAAGPGQTLVFATIPAVLVERGERNDRPLNMGAASKNDSFTQLTCRQKLLPRIRSPPCLLRSFEWRVNTSCVINSHKSARFVQPGSRQ